MIALGGNLPFEGREPKATIGCAIARMARSGLAVRAVSRFYRTPCYPAGTGPDFVNAAVAVVTEISPDALLERLHGIEAEFGRARRARWGARSLDLDLLAVGQAVRPNAAAQRRWAELPPETQAQAAPDRLILPHPRLQDRAFVLVPLADICPGWRHPLTGASVAQMLAALPAGEIAGVRPI